MFRAGFACGPTGVPGAGAPWRAGLLVVPVGGGPPASRPRRELRSARRLEARPGPTTAHGHRSLAPRSLRRPPHQWSLVADRCVVSKPARPCRRPRAPQPGSYWNPVSRSQPSPPPFLNHTQFRMQFPRYPLKPRIHNVGITTFSDFIETSLDRIACDFSEAVPATTHGHRSLALARGMGASASSTHSTAATATSSEPE